MSELPAIDYIAAWDRLPKSVKDAIGVLAIEASLLGFASGEFQGDEDGQGVVYLDADGRDQALMENGRTLAEMDDLIQSALPDLFGENPSDEHPNGTDPAWAMPIQTVARTTP